MVLTSQKFFPTIRSLLRVVVYKTLHSFKKATIMALNSHYETLCDSVKDSLARGENNEQDVNVLFAYLKAIPKRTAKPMFGEHEYRLELARELQELFQHHNLPSTAFNTALWASLFVAPLQQLESIVHQLQQSPTTLVVAGISSTAHTLPALCRHCKMFFS